MPRALKIPANELGFSMMRGQIGPTQYEALRTVAVQAFGNERGAALAGLQGNF